MRKSGLSAVCFLYLVAFYLFLFHSSANAEETLQDNSASQILELERLKEQNPSEYERAIRAKKTEFQESLKKFREERKGTDTEFLKKHEETRAIRLRELRQSHPQTFKRLMDRRLNRIEATRTTNPERFQRIMQNHPRLQRRMEELKNQKESLNSPGASHELLKTSGMGQQKWRDTSNMRERTGGDGPPEEENHQRDFRNRPMVRKGGLPGRRNTVN